MLFRILKLYAWFAFKIFCRKVIINKSDWLQAEGPLVLACNHPNSFLDGIILTLLFKNEVYSLARGDAFRPKGAGRILRWLRLLPVYRTSEGVENLEHNYTTFESCLEIFRKKGIVIIFSEGRCINEWHLRPLKKGTARLATSAWLEGIDLTVLPVGLNYNSFRNFGKNVVINFGEPIDKAMVLAHEADGKMYLSFNEQLEEQMKVVVFEIHPADKQMLKAKVGVPQPAAKKILLVIPAIIGFLLHAPLYFPAKLANEQFFDNDHFDSTMIAILFFAYPFYLLVISLCLGGITGWLYGMLVWIVFPFTAWACVQLKQQVS